MVCRHPFPTDSTSVGAGKASPPLRRPRNKLGTWSRWVTVISPWPASPHACSNHRCWYQVGCLPVVVRNLNPGRCAQAKSAGHIRNSHWDNPQPAGSLRCNRTRGCRNASTLAEGSASPLRFFFLIRPIIECGAPADIDRVSAVDFGGLIEYTVSKAAAMVMT